MSKRARRLGYNPFRNVSDIPGLTDDQREMVVEFVAHVLWRVEEETIGGDYCCKSYDPLVIDGDVAHSYVFDLWDGGRHHDLSGRTLDELVAAMENEVCETLRCALRDSVGGGDDSIE